MKAGIPMDSDRFAHLKDLLIESAYLPESEREIHLDEACKADW